jgi:hypothetical protein
MNDTDKIVAAILASGFGIIKADRSSVTEIVFVEAYERVLQEMAKRETVAKDAAKVDELMARQVAHRDEEEARKRSS